MDAIEEIAAATCEMLWEAGLAWLRALPRVQIHGPMPLVHASPESLWRGPAPEASDAELESIVIDAHIHRSYIRSVSNMLVANRSPLLTCCWMTSNALSSCRLPHADWMAKTLASASPQMP